MNHGFLIRIQAWAYSSGDGDLIDQARAGAREQTFLVEANDIREALEKAELFRDGMLTSPRVYQAPIIEIRQAGHDEHASFTRGDPCAENEARAEYRRRAAAHADERGSTLSTPSPSQGEGR